MLTLLYFAGMYFTRECVCVGVCECENNINTDIFVVQKYVYVLNARAWKIC